MRFSLKQAKNVIYLDHAAATPVAEDVLQAMLPFFSDFFANPSGLYTSSIQAREAVERARASVADTLLVGAEHITFTSGATEANNLAILGCARQYAHIGKHIIATSIEHQSVLKPLAELQKEGYEVTYLDVDQNGCINLSEFKNALRPDTILVTMMYVNNEIGVIAPIAQMGRMILNHRKAQSHPYPFFHSDMTQAINYLECQIPKLHLDLASLNASKIYGPKGIGALYASKHLVLQPIVFGGDQEKGLRSGTENVPGIVGMAQACASVQKIKAKEMARLTKLQQYFFDELKKIHPTVELNGPPIGSQRICNNLNVCFKGIDAEQLVLYLDAAGVECSMGSACESEKESGSHVLYAIGYHVEHVASSIRFSLGRASTKKDLDRSVQCIEKAIKKIS